MQHQVQTRPRSRRRLLTESLLVLAVCLIWGACVIVEIEQAETAATGEVITLRITVTEENAEGGTPWKGVLTIQVPEDWAFVTGEYSASDDNGAVGSGSLEESTMWADSAELAVPAESGMKWIGLLSDTGYLHAANLAVETEVQVKVGSTTGMFPLGYIVTKEAYFPSVGDWFGPNLEGADSTMNQMIEVTSGTAIEDVMQDGIPTDFMLEQNYPNPFNPTTQIRYVVQEAGPVTLTVFDLMGREVASLADGVKSVGIHEVSFSADDLPSGVYLYRLQAGSFTQTRSMILAK